MRLTQSLTELKGIGPAMSSQLQSLGLYTIKDLLYFLPRKYEDFTHVNALSDIRPGLVIAKVRFENLKTTRARRGLHITTAEAVDETSRIRVTWFNQPYRAASINQSEEYYMRGEYGLSGNRLQIVSPIIERADDVQQAHSKIVPVYRQRGKLTSRVFQSLIDKIYDDIQNMPETLPDWMIRNIGLMSIGRALQIMHRPLSADDLVAAKHRLAFEELLVVMLAVRLNRAQVESAAAPQIQFDETIAKEFVQHVPFDLTDSQRAVTWQIYKDMARQQPMNRLVEGDVGSGKTVIAAMAAIMALHGGKQVAFLAPTELLARQHFKTLSNLLDHTEYAAQTDLLIGGLKQAEKANIKKRIAAHEIRFIIGTHALLQEDIDWHDLGLVIVDEQHRFGVEQRQKLHNKAEHMPHVLCFTATPIPRSMALTVYGELDISIVSQMPAHRAGIETQIVSPNSRAQMYAQVVQQLQQGRQAFVVCPLIEDNQSVASVSVEEMYARLRNHELKKWRVGLLHGRMKTAEKDQIMQDFVAHRLDVLVATTVIEVGVDVPNATVIIIEGADRFGLAQAHQLRGRVGRGIHQGYCFLVMSDSKAPTKRIRALESTTDGFRLAELDLEIRGPGAIYGTRQHGALDLQIASLSDTHIIAQARAAAQEFFDKGEELLQYKQLAEAVQRAVNLTYLN